MNKQVGFLINPASGAAQGSRTYERLVHLLEKLSLPSSSYRIEFSRRGEAVAQAAQLALESEKVVAVGGDGTAVETITGVYLSARAVPVGLIPMGTGNDLARALGSYALFRKEGLEGCLRAVLQGVEVPFDLWRVNGRELMINYLSIGADAAVAHSFAAWRNRQRISFNSVYLNRLAFCALGLGRMRHTIQENALLTYQAGAQVHQRSLAGHRSLLLSNHQFYGGGTLVAPRAAFADGALEITPFLTLSSLIGLFLFQRTPLGLRQRYGNRLPHFPAQRVEISLPPGNFLQIDGEDKTALLAANRVVVEHCGRLSLLAKS
jgi:diacylglycerol kinase family enzyme